VCIQCHVQHVVVQVCCSVACVAFHNSCDACTYMMWSQHQHVFYVGKASVARKHGNSGIVARFKEHIMNTYKPIEAMRVVKRYRCWKNSLCHNMSCVPFAWAKENVILRYERHCEI
jgi:hypothetical protein